MTEETKTLLKLIKRAALFLVSLIERMEKGKKI